MNASALENIPAFPPIAAKLLRSASNPDAGVDDLINLMRGDAALSAEVIRYVNSPLFHFSTDIRTIQQAAPLLGMEKIRTLAFAAIARTYMRSLLIMDELRALWRYDMACALLSEMVARYCGVAQEAAYSAGLLHDIGRLGLIVAFPSEYSALLRTAAAKLEAGEDFDLVEYERSLFDIDHFAAGEWLARRWNLPDEYCAIAGRHPPPEEWQAPSLTSVVRAGCRLANSMGFGMFPKARMRSYREIVDGLPANSGHRFPEHEQDLRAQVDEEIEAFDLKTRCGGESGDGEMRELLQLDEASLNPSDADTEAAGERVLTMWPMLLAAVAVLAIVLTALKMAGWGG